jgi:hypothetical protein
MERALPHLASATVRIGSRLCRSGRADGVRTSARSRGNAREGLSMLEIGLFHNGASSLPVITNKDGVTFNDGSLPEVHRAAQRRRRPW